MKKEISFILLLPCLFLISCNFRLEPSEEDSYIPFGEIIKVGNRSIHVRMIGEGEPTILFFSDIDMYGSFTNWDIIQRTVGSTTKAISYDRYGYFWSEEGELPRTGEQISSEVEELLEVLHEDGPYIIVCHGMGGIYGRIFAGRNVDKICGMVLLDPLNPDSLERMEKVGVKKKIPDKNLRPLIKLMLTLGIKKETLQQYGIPDDFFNIAQAYYKKNSLAWFDETAVAVESMNQAKNYNNFGDIPVHILTSNKAPEASSNYLDDLWIELQKELLDLSTTTKQTILDGVGHYIHLDSPEIVLKAIDEMIVDINYK